MGVICVRERVMVCVCCDVMCWEVFCNCNCVCDWVCVCDCGWGDEMIEILVIDDIDIDVCIFMYLWDCGCIFLIGYLFCDL